MKKKLVAIVCALALCCTGCDILIYDGGNVELNKDAYMLTRITDIPDGWKSSEFMTFYYDINTYIVYVGTNSLSSNNSNIYELRSAEYRNYVYDEENNEFIGVK